MLVTRSKPQQECTCECGATLGYTMDDVYQKELDTIPTSFLQMNGDYITCPECGREIRVYPKY